MLETPTAERDLTIDEAMTIAMRCQENGQLSDAGVLYRKVLEVRPDHPGALHYSGVLAHHDGRTDEAISLIERSLTLVPDQPDWHSNLGIIFQNRGRLQDAVSCYRRALALKPTH